MDTFTIPGYKGETFTIKAVENVDDLPATKAALIKHGKEPVRYVLDRVIAGTRKKPYAIHCWRFVGSQNFISAY